jgi:hypothetical protein
MKVWRGLLLVLVLSAATFGMAACSDDTGGGDDGSGSSGGGQGTTLGTEATISISAGNKQIVLTSDTSSASNIPVNLSQFCNPDLSPTCDLANPANNEIVVSFIKISNTGLATLKLKELSVDNPEFFQIRSQQGEAVPASTGDPEFLISAKGVDGDNHYFDLVMFRPEEGTAPSTVITLRSNSDRNDGDFVKIKVQAEGLAPTISAPSNVSFDSVSQGAIKTKSINILNTGTGNLEISSFVLTGHPAFVFIVGPPYMDEVREWPVSAETAGGLTFDTPIVVSPGTAATANVRFVPEGPEPATANLILFSNDPNAKSGTLVKISGNQQGPCVTINPKKVDFGGKLIGKIATVDVEVVSCGEAPLALKSIGLDLTSSQDFALDLGGLPGLEPGTTEVVLDETPCQVDADCAGGLTCHETVCSVVLGIDETASFQVTFVPDEINPLGDEGQPIVDEGWINLTTNSFVSDLTVEVRGFGVETECPTSVIVIEEGEEVIPQTKLHLIGSQSYASNGDIQEYQWTVQQPVGSQSIFLPSASAPDPTFEVNVAGQYTFTLRVWDVDGEQSCVDAEYVVYVNPDEAIHVELLWDTPNDPNQTDEGPEAGADLDLHFLHPFATGQDVDGDGELDGWFDQPFDAFWFNAHPNWGSLDPMVDDDPGLDRDDTDGAGPENVNLNIPEEGRTYKVGVHYWNDHGFGPSLATVRVYIYTSLVFSVTDVELVNHDLWEVAEIKWPSGQVDPILGGNGSYKIIPNYQHPYFFE